MKAGTDQLLKFKKLRRELNRPFYQVKGILQALWDFTAVNAIDGDIGKYSNEEIAFALEWEGDPDELISTLVLTKWLDVDDDKDVRIRVHDWHDHCEEWVRLRIYRRNIKLQKTIKHQAQNQENVGNSEENVVRPYDNIVRAYDDVVRANGNVPLPNPNPNPNPNKKTPLPPKGGSDSDFFFEGNHSDLDDWFENKFWPPYPKKKSKGQAIKAIKALKPNPALREKILAGLERAKLSRQWRKDNGEFIPNAATWIRALGWEDEEFSGPEGPDTGGAENVLRLF